MGEDGVVVIGASLKSETDVASLVDRGGLVCM